MKYACLITVLNFLCLTICQSQVRSIAGYELSKSQIPSYDFYDDQRGSLGFSYKGEKQYWHGDEVKIIRKRVEGLGDLSLIYLSFFKGVLFQIAVQFPGDDLIKAISSKTGSGTKYKEIKPTRCGASEYKYVTNWKDDFTTMYYVDQRYFEGCNDLYYAALFIKDRVLFAEAKRYSDSVEISAKNAKYRATYDMVK